MDSTSILSLLERLESEIDGLEDSLVPLLETDLSNITSKLPLLDKAKLYVLMTYAVESILFSYLRLNGSKAREHPVFQELTRVKQYFEKIKAAENTIPDHATLSLDKDAAARLISAGLAGNTKLDLERAERLAKDKARAHFKAGKKLQDDQTETAQSGTTSQVGGTSSHYVSEGVIGAPESTRSTSRKRKADMLKTHYS